LKKAKSPKFLADRILKAKTWLNTLKLGAQLNISFGLVMFVPMIIATVFSIVYYSNKIEQEAVNKISSDSNMAKLIYQNALLKMETLADAYAQKKTLTGLLRLGLGVKLGRDLATSAPLDGLDMVTVVDKENSVMVRSHAPEKIEEPYPAKPYIGAGFEGKSQYGVELIQSKELIRAGFTSKDKIDPKAKTILALTGVAPVYDRNRRQIEGVLIAQRLLTSSAALITETCEALDTNAGIFSMTDLVASCTSHKEKAKFFPPTKKILETILRQNVSLHTVDMSRGGSISKFFPLLDLNNQPVGVFMVQTEVDAYLQTRYIAIGTLVAIFVIGVLLAYSVKSFIERRIVEPLRLLKIGTEMVASGEYTHMLEEKSGDEIGELTIAFNDMTADLQQYDQQLKEYNLQLEERVKERTAELQRAMEALEETMETLNPGVSRLIRDNNQQEGLVDATELVVDICNYTTLNMNLGEKVMESLMTTFFGESHKLLAKYRGVLDKTVGDQIVAIFGIPKDFTKASPTHPFDAVECALKMLDVADKINVDMHTSIQDNYTAIVDRHKTLSSEDREKIKLEELRFQCRIGINTSNSKSQREIDMMRMVMMGAETCKDYTAQGGSIIYAFRLESSGTPGEISIGENTKQIVEHVYLLEELGTISLKGLGEQTGYRVVGRCSILDNIYPKTFFFQQYCDNLPEELFEMLVSIKMGKISINEIRRLTKYLDVDIPYLEHFSGLFNLASARALFSYAVGKKMGLEPERLRALLMASLLSNAISLRNIAVEYLNFVSTTIQVPKRLQTMVTKTIMEDLKRSVPTGVEAKIIALCNHFDHLVFDRTILRRRLKEIKKPKDVVAQMKKDDTYDTSLVEVLEELMIAKEGFSDGKASYRRLEAVSLPKDPHKLAQAIERKFTSAQRKKLLEHLAGIEPTHAHNQVKA
jgi:class 3 adenylate cyclase/HAMP domain-containing protein